MSNLKFLKFPSLRLWHDFDPSKVPSSIMEEEWYSTEKIHGSNVSVISNGTDVAYASRDTLMDSNHDLYKVFRNLDISRYMEPINMILADYNGTQVTLYGEGYGAGIQKMGYNKNQERTTGFLMFNGFVETSPDKYKILSRIDLEKYFPEDMLVPIESRGKLTDIIEKDDLGKASNLGGEREGYVYQLSNPGIYDDTLPTPEFYGVKNKTKKFMEVGSAPKVVKEERILNASENELMMDLSRYITSARTQNVLSHGTINTDNKSAAMGKLIKAVWNDILEEYPQTLDPESDSIKAIEKQLKPEIVKIAKEELGV